VEDEGDDPPVRGAIVGVLPKWGHPFVPHAIVRALSLRGVRAVAVETLDRMGPVAGERESRLMSELASLRSGVADPIRVSAMPALYGRDHRLLNYLNELLRTGNRWGRALAASELFGLGEVETALGAARDSAPRVRRSLAWAIGRYGEQRGAEILEQLLDDPDDGVANEAGRSLMLLGGQAPIAPRRSGAFMWTPLLEERANFAWPIPNRPPVCRSRRSKREGSADLARPNFK